MAVCLRKMRAKRAAAEILSFFEKGCYYGGLESLLADYDALERENEELRRKVAELEAATMTDGEKARAFLASVPFETFHSRDLRETNPELKAKIDRAFYTVQADDALWCGLKDLPHEQWRDFYVFEALYRVSNLGRMKSFYGLADRILKGSKNRKTGYIVVNVSVKGRYQHNLVHRLVAEVFIPNPEGKSQVNHRWGVKTDNRVSELEWATCAENLDHAYRIGLKKSSVGNLSADDFCYIRENPDGLTQIALGEKFGVSNSTIWRIQHGKRIKT